MPGRLPARLPEPPYYAAILTSLRNGEGAEEYAAVAVRMRELAEQQPGFLAVEGARDAEGFGISVSYWRDAESVAAWRDHAEHTLTREFSRVNWYEALAVHVARVERAYRVTPEGIEHHG
ncbi:antibiotic biosynthesis monooxygenase [Kitasatospora sp. MMS16-BH015]|uniref:antibiotic biosynthesis monooxygenase family protein n=1 Tax=Kitasatospora sp. MMS16-BH015 TaxID=2018025 RepID=UPI000CA38C2A|nr:antibiotic biosynthesis monooxygenase [Kitasatospora sp. MMS16-BH015]AUG80720.1 antibiotic biosynthesis monooxygenase [Kitasatospora sp. MMS16-BH015]